MFNVLCLKNSNNNEKIPVQSNIFVIKLNLKVLDFFYGKRIIQKDITAQIDNRVLI